MEELIYSRRGFHVMWTDSNSSSLDFTPLHSSESKLQYFSSKTKDTKIFLITGLGVTK